MSLVTFKCNKCARTFRYGREEGVGLMCECQKGFLERKENEMLENVMEELIAAIKANTEALSGGAAGTAAASEPDKAKTKKGKAGKKGKKSETAVTVDSVKAMAKKIAMKTDDPKDCMIQIRAVVSEVADSCYSDANRGLDSFDETGLILLKEELGSFEYNDNTTDADGEPDGMDI